MATATIIENTAVVAEADDFEFALKHPLWVNIKPILDSIAGKLTDDEIDQWFVELEAANEARGFHLELTAEGELVISPMVNRKGSYAELEMGTDVKIWSRLNGGETHGANANMRLPDGSRIRPDALWISPERLTELPSTDDDQAITVYPDFVAEIVSGTDTLPPLLRKMDIYMANGAQLGWLIDPYRRRVYVYRPGVDVEILDDPETISGEPVMPGFVFQVRERIFALHGDSAA